MALGSPRSAAFCNRARPLLRPLEAHGAIININSYMEVGASRPGWLQTHPCCCILFHLAVTWRRAEEPPPEGVVATC